MVSQARCRQADEGESAASERVGGIDDGDVTSRLIYQ